MTGRQPLLTGTRLVGAIAVTAMMVAGITTLALADTRSAAAPGPVPPSAAVLGPGPVTVEIDVHHSRFHPTPIRVRPATEVEFVIVNRDPIGHEFIIGDAAVHARHATGHEAAHGAVPGEVSIAPGTTASTTFAFTEPGRVLFACHLPGHFEYGMKGYVRVVAG